MNVMFWDVVRALAILTLTWFLATWLRHPVRRLLAGHVEPTTAGFLLGAVRPVCMALALPPALDAVGVSMTSTLAVLSTAGLAIALALRDALSNVASGAILLTVRPFLVGDRVSVAGHTGVVSRIGFLLVELDTDDGRRVSVMNDKVVALPMERHGADGLVRLELVVRLPRRPGAVAEVEAVAHTMGAEVVVQEVETERVRVAVRVRVHPTELAARQRALWAALDSHVFNG
jgi:small-conductance mechanosensitive channel